MISLLRNHMRWLLGIVAAVVIISFVWFYNRADLARINRERVGEIYGREIVRQDVLKLIRYLGLLSDLGLFEMIIPLSNAPARELAEQEFAFNLMVLREEARRMNISPDTAQIKAAQMALPVFQTNGQFDPRRLAAFMQENLSPRGFTELQIDEAITDLIKFRTIRTLVSDLVSVPPKDARREWERAHSAYSAGLIRLDLEKFKDGPAPSEEEIARRFEIRAQTLKTEPRRKVTIARLALPESDRSLEGRARVDALQRVADKAFTLSQAILEPGADFNRLAAEAGAAVSTTDFFTETSLPENIAGIPGAADAIRLLNPEDASSDVLQNGDEFVVLHLAGFEPSRPMTLDEARPLLIADLQKENASRRLREEAAKLRDALAAAGPFSEASKELLASKGLKMERPEPFTFTKLPPELESSGSVLETLLGLAPGAVSPPVPTENGAVLVALESVKPPPAEDYEKDRVATEMRSLNRERNAAFLAWLKDRRAASGLRLIGAGQP